MTEVKNLACVFAPREAFGAMLSQQVPALTLCGTDGGLTMRCVIRAAEEVPDRS
jgi:hypothetical protein